jgi:hypothetical protein
VRATSSRGNQYLERLGPALIVLAVLLVPAGCRESSRHPAPDGRVYANEAYVRYFGDPPEIEEGTYFARIGFFPLAADPDRVRPVPLFIFREEGQPDLLLEALLRDWRFSVHSGLRNPFPPGSVIRVTGLTGGSVTVDLSGPLVDPASGDLRGMIASVAETLLQFEEIDRVRVTVAGTPPPGIPPEGLRRDQGRIAPPGPPLLLMVVGVWEPDQGEPEELLINFDRPVAVREIRLLDGDGREITGEYFRTAFDMSVALHPAGPPALREGMAVRVVWEVSDGLGRTGRGGQDFILERQDHREGQ